MRLDTANQAVMQARLPNCAGANIPNHTHDLVPHNTGAGHAISNPKS
jgi:hypothetical protein